jgi:hypothetical protein
MEQFEQKTVFFRPDAEPEEKMWWRQHASPTKLRYLKQYAIGNTALDLGMGAGHYTQALMIQNFSVVGIDREYYDVDGLHRKLTQAGFRVLTIQKEGAVHPAVLAEFVRPRFLRRLAWLGLKELVKLKLLSSAELMADLYAVAEVE